MDSSCFTMSYLESLSTGELITLAEKSGLDIPHGLERVFIIEELLYLGHNGDDKADDIVDMSHHEFKELAALPKHYNISSVEVLVRDPLWAFVFWDLKEHDRLLHQKMADFPGYWLRVIPMKEEANQQEDTHAARQRVPDLASSFTVAVGLNDSGWYVGFPPDDGRWFKIELCTMYQDDFTVLAESPSFMLPGLIGRRDDLQENRLAQLSGVDHFALAHSEDRLSRPRGI
jgi:hypothetical protein